MRSLFKHFLVPFGVGALIGGAIAMYVSSKYQSLEDLDLKELYDLLLKEENRENYELCAMIRDEIEVRKLQLNNRRV